METLDKHFRALARASFARYGFAYADLLAQWPAIIGERLSAACGPHRITWPRGQDAERKIGGTLIVHALPGRALDLQHQVPQIIERINGFYGYGAIAAVKIVQGRLSPKRTRPAAPPLLAEDRAQALEAKLASVADPALKEALRRLGTGALARPPHDK